MAKKKSALYAAFIFIAAFAVRLIYILNTTVYERGHDVGAYTSLTDGQVNPGHLGYIEYLVKFKALPDFNPFNLFSYYHPPLHHILSALVVKASLFFGATYEQAFENIQYLILAYSMLFLLCCYLILKELSKKDTYVLIPFALIAFHPSLIYMSAYVNNDMLTMLIMALLIYTTLKWMRSYRFKYLIYLALLFGIGMCVKISVIIMALPVGIVMLLHLIDMAKRGKIGRCIKEYVVFAVLSIPLALSWTIRNFIRFNEKPGIASATSEDIKYMGMYSLAQRIGWPGNWNLSYPFHNIYGSESDNIWLIMFRTALFGEMRPDVSGLSLSLCQIAFVLSVVVAIVLTVIFIFVCVKMIFGSKEEFSQNAWGFMLLSFLTVIITFVLFAIKYPYTCSCDFRYIVISLLFIASGIVGIRGINAKK